MTVHNNIDKIFKEGLSDYSEKAPTFIWDNIEQELSSNQNTKKRTVFYSIAASIALLLSFGAGYLFTTPDANQQVAQLNDSKNTINTIEQPSEDNNAIILSTTEKKPKQQPKKKVINTIKTTEVKETHETEEKTKVVAPVKEGSKIKKANSSGTLLPPMFASQEGFNATNANSNKYTETEVTENHELLAEIKSIESIIKVSNIENGLIYELRQAPLFEIEDIEPSKKVENTWAVGVNGTPLLSYRNVASTSSEAMYSAVNTSGLQQNYQNEKPLMAYAAGVNVNYKLASRWNIQSGLYYSETGQIIENINLAQSPWSVYNTNGSDEYTVNTSAGNLVVNESTETLVDRVEQLNTFAKPATILDQEGAELTEDATNSTNSEFIQKFQYYEIPLIISYKLINRKLNVNLSGGLSANFLANNSNYIQDANGKSEIDSEIEGLKSTSYSSIIGFGFEYPIITNISFNLNPTFRYSLISINTSGNTHPYSFGVFTGLIYSF